VVKNTGATVLYASFSSAGIPKEPPTEVVSEGLTVTRRIAALDGTPTSGPYEQGKTYRMEITLKPQSSLENVVVADLLPAGFEVENARLSGIEGDAVEGSRVLPEHLDIRDDRVIFAYRSLSSREHVFSYVVRAVTPGTFAHPPVTAECMYDPAIRARNLQGDVVVEAR
jgi:hypothetical protein